MDFTYNNIFIKEEPFEEFVAKEEPSDEMVIKEEPCEEFVTKEGPSEVIINKKEPCEEFVAKEGPSEVMIKKKEPSKRIKSHETDDQKLGRISKFQKLQDERYDSDFGIKKEIESKEEEGSLDFKMEPSKNSGDLKQISGINECKLPTDSIEDLVSQSNIKEESLEEEIGSEKDFFENLAKSKLPLRIKQESSEDCNTSNNGNITISCTPFSQQKEGFTLSPVPQTRSMMKKKYRKQCRQEGKAHINSKGKFIKGKTYKHIECNCRLKCTDKLNIEERKMICQHFWALGHWQAQTIFIVNNVKIHDVKKKKPDTPKKHHREFYLNGKNICKTAFLASLNISNKRLDYAVRRKNKDGYISPDKRGGRPYNKTPEGSLYSIHVFLSDFPKYTSHYSDSQEVYFHPELSVQKLHELYVEKMNENSSEKFIVSYKIFLKSFRSFNVSIYVPKQNICQLCDKLNIKIESSSPISKKDAMKQRELHQLKASFARQHFKKMTNQAKDDDSFLCLSFDMEKTQPIPYLKKSVLFYNRQLWLLNLGIKLMHSNEGYMCLWNESEGRRGVNEFCSSLFEFLRTYNAGNRKRIVSFSDGCGWQNRSKTIVAFMMFSCIYFGFESWEHTYLESGHSFVPNDSDFGKIEKKKRTMQAIFTETEWMELIKKANVKKPFKIIEMKGKFLDFKSLQKSLVYRSRDTNGDLFSLLDMKWFRVNKHSGIVNFKTSLDPEFIEKSIDFAPAEGISFPEVSPSKCPGVQISVEKYVDLISMLNYIPPVHHNFFINLPYNENAEQETRQLEFYPEGFDDEEEINN